MSAKVRGRIMAITTTDNGEDAIPLNEARFEWNGINPIDVSLETFKNIDVNVLTSLGDGRYLLSSSQSCFLLTPIYPIDLSENKIAFNVSIEAYK